MKNIVLLSAIFLSTIVLAGCGQQQLNQTPPTKPEVQQSTQNQPQVNQPVSSESNVLQTYTNEIYKYKFDYPAGTVIREAQKNDFGVPTEEIKGGATLDSIFEKYTGKICITADYSDGTVYISSPENKDNKYVLCSGRTGVGSEAKVATSKENITIAGKTYIVDNQDIFEEGKHNYLVYINLEDETKITLSSFSPETNTVLKKIVESYTPIQ